MVTDTATTATTTSASMATTTNVPLPAATAETTLKPVKQEPPFQPKDTNMQGSPDVSTSDSDSILPLSISFIPEACIFCPQLSSDFATNLIHMQKSHGLFIPTSIDGGALHLAVDMETLVDYMHLVIFGYHECLFCGTQRADVWAARQHMIGRGHCRIELAEAESEWRDFYEGDDNLEPEVEDEDESEIEEALKREDQAELGSYWRCDAYVSDEGQIPRVCDGDILRLSSGKVVAHRTAPAPRNPNRKPLTGEKSKYSRRGIDRSLQEDMLSPPEQHTSTTGPTTDAADLLKTGTDAEPQPSSSTSPSQAKTLSRTDRRRLLASKPSAVTAAVANMSKRDRAVLAHLSPAERRAMVVSQFKQQDRAHTAERKYWSKFERRQDQPAEGGKVYIGGG